MSQVQRDLEECQAMCEELREKISSLRTQTSMSLVCLLSIPHPPLRLPLPFRRYRFGRISRRPRHLRRLSSKATKTVHWAFRENLRPTLGTRLEVHRHGFARWKAYCLELPFGKSAVGHNTQFGMGYDLRIFTLLRLHRKRWFR